MSEQLLSTPKIGSGQAAGGGGVNLWWNSGRGPLRAFAPKITKLNTKSPPEGEGGLNLWHLGDRYRTWSHAQIFFGRQRFEFFSRNQRIQTARTPQHRAIMTSAHADRAFNFRGRRWEARPKKVPRNSGWGGVDEGHR